VIAAEPLGEEQATEQMDIGAATPVAQVIEEVLAAPAPSSPSVVGVSEP
jgi:hypothetical protein